MRTFISVLVMFFSIALMAQDEAPVNRPGLTLKETFDVYTADILKPDLEAMMTTVTKEHNFTFLTTSGSLLGSVEEYRKFHEEWFVEQGWEISFELVECHEGRDYGYTLAKYHYREVDPKTGDIRASDSWFTMIFHKEDGMWKVVHDANTPIRPIE